MLPVQIEDAGDLWRPDLLNLLFYFPARRRRAASRTLRVPLACNSSTMVIIQSAWAPGDGQHLQMNRAPSVDACGDCRALFKGWGRGI